MAASSGNKAKGRQSNKKKTYYARQFERTKSNKIRRLRKRMDWDKSAGPRIGQLVAGK